jgi:hypothetical protein
MKRPPPIELAALFLKKLELNKLITLFLLIYIAPPLLIT